MARQHRNRLCGVDHRAPAYRKDPIAATIAKGAEGRPRTLAVLETPGWNVASASAKQQLNDTVARLKSAGIDTRTRHNDRAVAELEEELVNAAGLSYRVNGFETRWFFTTMRDRDESLLGPTTKERSFIYDGLTLAEYRADLAERARVRAVYAALAHNCDAAIALPAPGGAPEGLSSTGNPDFAVPASLLGVPALSLPLFQDDGMPLGLQVIGYRDRDADAFAITAWLMQAR